MWALIALNFDLNATGEELRLQAWLHKDLQIKDEGLSWQKDSEMWNQTESIGSSLQFYIDMFLAKLKSKWFGPFIVKSMKWFGAIEIEDLETK